MLGLAPLTIGVFGAGFVALGSVEPLRLQSTCALVSTILFCVTIAVWRAHVNWTRWRLMLTAFSALLIASHLVIFQPLWSVSCIETELLMSQSLGIYGVWRLACPFMWWGVLVLVRREQRERIGGRQRMTKSAIRLLIGLSLIPILPAVFFICFVGLDKEFGFTDELSTATSLAICELLAIGLWVVVWRNAVRWTPMRILGTSLLAVGLLPTALAPYFPKGNDMAEVIVYTSPVWMWGVWIIGTAWLWRDRSGDELRLTDAAQDSDRISPTCPKCAYSLRGLSEARCPECGWTGTLDSVFDASLGIADV